MSRLADYNSTVSTWKPSGEQVMQTYKRQAIAMTWDFPESNALGSSAVCWSKAVKYTADNLEITAYGDAKTGHARQDDAARQSASEHQIVSTDPPYYDNIGYADLSDFFYVWLRRSLQPVFPNLFATLAVPKAEELVATPYRHGGKKEAEAFFLDGMTEAMHRLAEQAHPAFPVTIYYAFKQSETTSTDGTASTGWETFLDAVIRAGFSLSGTWPTPYRTECNRTLGFGYKRARLIHCPRVPAATDRTLRRLTRGEFLNTLRAELPAAVRTMQAENVAPVDLAQASIGPGMAVFTRYSRVVDSEGSDLTVRDALTLINEVSGRGAR